MIIQDVLDLAKFSELSSVAIKDNTVALLLFVNAGMLELHKRFPLKTEEHVIVLEEGVTLYTMPTNFLYATSAWGEPGVSTLGEAVPLPINDEDEPTSIFFPNYKQVQIPLTTEGSRISIIYGAKPVKYVEADLAQELDLPETLIDPLIHYMGYKAHSGIKGDSQSENNAHYFRFEKSCAKARELGVAYPIDSWRMIDRLGTRGFA
jgi:hypothetical protein